MISSSIWHCDYCLGDICCCIKSNLPFLSSIVTMPELFSFFSRRWRWSQGAHQEGSTAQPLAEDTPGDGFCPLQSPGLTDRPFSQQGTALSLSPLCICMQRMWPVPALQWGCQPFPLSLWHLVTGISSSLQLGLHSFRTNRVPLICAGEKAFFRMASSEGRWWL